ncbi:hypothetical protein VTP01DRAFT_8840 [Rhizomucor pusillus]|uniref:uncharacterized protein n=1 Tax=Rhizomucor pusillus TaxID=4840 RepID=UPI003744511A
MLPALFVLLLRLSAVLVDAQLMAPTHNYNVSSPVTNGPYVVNQMLPCTYRLFADVDSSSLRLKITLKSLAPPTSPSLSSNTTKVTAKQTSPSATASSATASPTGGVGTSATTNGTILIADNADVSKSEASAKREGNLTYYEHSINYQIPSTLPPGPYEVVFYDTSTDAKLSIPIEIRAAALTPSATSSGGSDNAPGGSKPGTTSSDGAHSIFAGGAPSRRHSLEYVSIFVVICLAILYR